MKYLRNIIFIVTFSLLEKSFAWSCPNCKDFLATESASALARGYYWSILMMVSLPFVLVGMISFLIFLNVRSKRKLSTEDPL
ncbi:MAG: hypothetical protein HYS08_06470 [Chlamydiae bacterium]|nr:hypothetical protein [Chlamydiota bacterium]MBI3265594.1 hypothetical protein [Chlamydiota bacterium]